MNSKINPLTSLRFFAAILIVIGHGSQIPAFKNFEFNLFNVGNCVSFFYVLSGFILTYNYYSMVSYKRYILARIARVWPLHVVMLLIVIYVLGYDAGNTKVLLANLFSVQSWFPYSNYFYSYNAVSWSISTEISFYIAFPFLLWLMKNKFPVLILLSIIFLLTPMMLSIGYGLPVKPSPDYVSSSFWLYINPISRSVEFMSGMIACSIFMKRDGVNSRFKLAKEIASLLIMVAAMYTTNALWFIYKENSFAAFFGWLATAGSFIFISLFIYTIAKCNGGIGKVLSFKWLVYFGEISFSMYMCHQVILNFINKHFSNEALAHSTVFYIAYIVSVFICSSLLFHIVEVPARRAIRGLFAEKRVVS